MHELGISRSIVAIVEEAAKGKRVRKVTLEIGELSGVLSDAIRFCFHAVAQGTCAEDATLEIDDIKAHARCNECAIEFATPTLFTTCRCGARALVRLRGDEINVRSIEVEETAHV